MTNLIFGLDGVMVNRVVINLSEMLLIARSLPDGAPGDYGDKVNCKERLIELAKDSLSVLPPPVIPERWL